MDARNKQHIMAPLAQEIRMEDQESNGSDEAPRGVLQPGGKGKGTAPAVAKAACKRKEAVVPVAKKHSAASSAQKTKALEKKKRLELEAAQNGKAAVEEEEEEEEEEEDNSSDEDYDEEGESVDEDSDDDSGYEEEEELVARQPPPLMADEVARENLPVHEQLQKVEQPVVVDQTHGRDHNERAIVKVRKFEGCRMLAEVVRSEDNGVASRTRRRKVPKRRRLYSRL